MRIRVLAKIEGGGVFWGDGADERDALDTTFTGLLSAEGGDDLVLENMSAHEILEKAWEQLDLEFVEKVSLDEMLETNLIRKNADTDDADDTTMGIIHRF